MYETTLFSSQQNFAQRIGRYGWNYTCAAEEGHAEAQLFLGQRFKNGVSGVQPQDDGKTFHWLSKAAQQGNVEAQYKMLVCAMVMVMVWNKTKSKHFNGI
jgi:TPR repeat protein